MSDSGTTPPAATAVAATPKRKRPTWVWVTVIVVVAVLLISCSCGWATWALMQEDGATVSGVGDAVAVIYIDGQIAGVDSGSSLSGGYVTPELIIGQLAQAEDDPTVKAIILRIDSPGGTASASEEIAMEVARVEKPIIASVGDVCASGAYMIASQCDEIVCTNSSDIGSIGVIIQVGDYSGLLEKLGVKFVSIHEGEFKDAGAPWRSLTTSETAMLEEDIKLVYDEFIAVVAEGRGMKESEVRELATGWAWPGKRAKELGLADTIGNYSDAVDVAAKAGKIEGEPRIVTYRDESFSALLRGLTSSIDRLGGATALTEELLNDGRPTIE